MIIRQSLEARKGRLHSAELFFENALPENAGKPATICFMTMASLAIRILEWMFFVGMAGSTVVVVISFIEDAKELFGGE